MVEIKKLNLRLMFKNNIGITAMPGAFVLLWSTGFIGAKLGLPYAESMTFLALRFCLALIILYSLCLIVKSSWPNSLNQYFHIIIAGLLIHGAYLGGVYSGIQFGVEAGTSALIVALQPPLVTLFAYWVLKERTTYIQWLGIMLGFSGVALVVWNKLSLEMGTLEGIGLHVIALFGISAGTLYQKRFCSHMNLLSGCAIQLTAAAVLVGILAITLETGRIYWTSDFIFSLVWLSIVLSIGAWMLFYVLIKKGAASKVSSLLFLVPPSTALIAWPLFGETLDNLSIFGMATAVIGVALINVRTHKTS